MNVDTVSHPFFTSRNMFPKGLPNEFSFISTFRLKNKGRKKTWDLMRIEGLNGEPQFSVTLNGKTRSLQFQYINYNNELAVLDFPRNKMIRKVSKLYTRLLSVGNIWIFNDKYGYIEACLQQLRN